MNSSIYYNKGKTREKNEDDYLLAIDDEQKLIAVADGMGGHKAGEVASNLVINYIEKYNYNIDGNIFNDINNAINEASKELIKMGKENKKYYNMGTTLSMGIIHNNKLFIGHVGDSRIYMFRNNKLKLLTKDHSLVNKLLEDNKIDAEQAFNHPQKHILTQALGLNQELKIENKEVELSSGDLLLFCSDGLTDMVKDEEIKRVMQDKYNKVKNNINEVSECLGQKALDNGGNDNITLIMVKL